MKMRLSDGGAVSYTELGAMDIFDFWVLVTEYDEKLTKQANKNNPEKRNRKELDKKENNGSNA